MNQEVAQKTKEESSPTPLGMVVVCLVYIALGKLGLSFAEVNPSASAIWIPTAVSLASFLIFGVRIWPAIFIGAFLVNFTTTGIIWTSVLISLGNTLEGFVGAYLVNKFAGGRKALNHTHDFYRFLILGVLISTMVSATIGVSTLVFGGLASWENYGQIWITWWLGDATGALIFTPVILFWAASRKLKLSFKKILESWALVGAVFVVTWVILHNSLSFSYFIIPLLVWLVLRFDPREVSGYIAFFSVITALNVNAGTGPFLNYDQNASLLFAQTFIGVISLSILPLSVFLHEQKLAKWKRDQLAFIVESSNNAVISRTLEGKITYWNKAAENLYGYSAKEAIGQDTYIITPKEKWQELNQITENIKEGIRIESLETTRLHKDGSYRDVIVTSSPIIDDEENIVGVSTITSDITEQKKLQRAALQERIKSEEKLRSNFLAQAAHEFRTPLAIIKGNIDLTPEEAKKNSKLNGVFDSINEEVNRLSDLITNLLTVTRKKEVKYRKLDLIAKFDKSEPKEGEELVK